MLTRRIIPCLDVKNGRVVKGKKFLDNYEVYGTRRNFYVAIQQFFKSVYQETTDENLEQIADKYFNEQNRKNLSKKTNLKILEKI